MRRRSKIVATLGPATDDVDVLSEMIISGLDVARINFSHGNYSDLSNRLKKLRKASERCNKYVGVIGDLQGPKIRVRRFLNNRATLKCGDSFFLDANFKEKGSKEGVGVAFDRLHEDVSVGDILLLNDGQIKLQVDEIDGSRILTTVLIGGVISDHKGINREGGGLSAGALTLKDKADIKFAVKERLDFLAVSFVRNSNDILYARRLLSEAGGSARLIAKIERMEALENISEIIDVSDALMVARGDLGVEMGYAELTGQQKKIIEMTRRQNKVVITATQMMESMIKNPIPTRAEVSDVANAVMDGTDAVMLSAETAVGKYPIEVVKAVSDICKGAEKHIKESLRSGQRYDDRFSEVDEAIAMAVMYSANHLNVKAIIALTETGTTALWMSRVRSDIPIYAFTPHDETSRRVSLYRGVYPVSFSINTSDRHILYRDIFKTLLSNNLVQKQDRVIFTKGDLDGVSGGTNSMQIIEVNVDT